MTIKRYFITLVRLNLKPYFGVSPRRRTRIINFLPNNLEQLIMTTIKEIAESYLKKNLLQASELPNNQKIKKLGAMKSLFGYSFFLSLALGIVSSNFVIAGVMGTSKAFAQNISSCMVSEGYINIYNSKGERIQRLTVGSWYEIDERYERNDWKGWQKILSYTRGNNDKKLIVRGYEDQMYINNSDKTGGGPCESAAPLSNTGTRPPKKPR
jgi:hypothetical protein